MLTTAVKFAWIADPLSIAVQDIQSLDTYSF